MSGHSKWSTIKRKKAAIDAKRGKIFTKLLREVTVAARMGGGDRDGNPRLRAAIQDARSNNVPSDNIDRAVKKGTGELEGVAYDEVTYEGYGPGGVAVLVETMTDNKNRTVGEVRHVFTKYGGNLGENGCVAWMFDQRGYFVIEAEKMDEEAFIELALELGADDISTEGDEYEIFTERSEYLTMKEALDGQDIEVSLGQLSMVPKSTAEVSGGDLQRAIQMLEALEDLDDVQNVWANFDPDSLDALEAG